MAVKSKNSKKKPTASKKKAIVKPVKKAAKTKVAAKKIKKPTKPISKKLPKKVKEIKAKLVASKLPAGKTGKIAVKTKELKKSKAVVVTPTVNTKPAKIVAPKKEKEIVVQAKKEVKVLPTPPVQKPIIVSNHPKTKIKTILVSQPRPENEKSPYLDLARKYNLKIDFRQFISIEGVPAKEFRQQRVGILEHSAVILTSRIAIDHYFRMANEMRVTIPETMKYFCLSESVAYYLQKYVQYRKRKIFFGHQTIIDLVDVIKKHKEEKFLLPVSDVHREQIVDLLDALSVKFTKATFYRTVHSDLSDLKGVLDYDAVVFFTPAGIKSLKKNFPDLKQNDLRIAAFGYNTAQTVQEMGYRLDILSPTPQAPSMTMALEQYLREANKR